MIKEKSSAFHPERPIMVMLLLLAVSALVGIVFTVRAVITDGPQRVRTRDNLVVR